LPSHSRRASYAALSYCWGLETEVRPIKTMKNNVARFSESIVAADLPLTIRQAIEVTRILNLEYLWVDSLCIIQDDDDDWRKESQMMGMIYQNATVTIAATSARHCNEGLFLAIPNRLWDHLDSDSEIGQSRWNTRAWVVQERILSRRILHFGRTQLYWECQESLHAESNSMPIPSDTRFLLNHKLENMAGMDMGIPAQAAMQRSWERIVGIYNVCELQRETDKLPAVVGFAREIAIMSGQTFCAGVWLEDIARGLYW
ncbi:HET-domain-containing protein, partial [Dothidotthia symphoricarpi CBS 119687]